MCKKLFPATLAVLTFLVAGLFSLQTVSALETQNLTVTPDGYFDFGPAIYKIDASPGATLTYPLQLTSRSEQEMNYLIQVEDYQGSSDPSQSHVLLGEQSGLYGARDWITLEANQFNLGLGDRVLFDVTINVPADADAGEHYVSVLASRQPLPSQDATGNNVSITSRIGSLFLINIAGDVVKDGNLTDFTATGNWPDDSSNFSNWFASKPFEFAITFQNNGTTHLEPSGQIIISNLFGQVIETIPVEPFNVLRSSSRTQAVTVDSQALFGAYTATLTLDNTLGETQTQTLDFYYFPLPISLIVLISVVMASIVGIILLTRKKKHA